jgi:hypothetical protein
MLKFDEDTLKIACPCIIPRNRNSFNHNSLAAQLLGVRISEETIGGYAQVRLLIRSSELPVGNARLKVDPRSDD